MGPDYQTFITADNTEIIGRYFEPAPEPVGSIIIAPAMGVLQRFYQPLASWLAQQGYLTLTFDYRGMGLSLQGKLRNVEATLTDWGRYDCSAALEHIVKRSGDRPVYWLGHSFGGQVIPLVENFTAVYRIINVGTGSGYWRENAIARYKVWFLWFVAAPLSLNLLGYFPGKRLGFIGDLPKGAMEQWRRWCLHPQYSFGEEGETMQERFAAIDQPITSFALTDDEFMSRENMESMLGFYSNAQTQLKWIAPQDINKNRIGHFGFFRKDYEEPLWQNYLLPELSGG